MVVSLFATLFRSQAALMATEVEFEYRSSAASSSMSVSSAASSASSEDAEGEWEQTEKKRSKPNEDALPVLLVDVKASRALVFEAVVRRGARRVQDGGIRHHKVGWQRLPRRGGRPQETSPSHHGSVRSVIHSSSYSGCVVAGSNSVSDDEARGRFVVFFGEAFGSAMAMARRGAGKGAQNFREQHTAIRDGRNAGPSGGSGAGGYTKRAADAAGV